MVLPHTLEVDTRHCVAIAPEVDIGHLCAIAPEVDT